MRNAAFTRVSSRIVEFSAALNDTPSAPLCSRIVEFSATPDDPEVLAASAESDAFPHSRKGGMCSPQPWNDHDLALLQPLHSGSASPRLLQCWILASQQNNEQLKRKMQPLHGSAFSDYGVPTTPEVLLCN